MLSKLAAQESHGAPPGVYLLLFWVTFWPGAPLAGMAAPAVWRARREPGAQFLLAWLIPSWIVFELVLTKLPHYVLPLYPAIAILTVGALERRVLSRSWLRRGAAWWFVIPALASVIAVVGAIDADAPAGVSGLAVRGGGADLRAVRLVAVRRQSRRTLAAERRGRGDVPGRGDLRRRGAGADAAVSERRDRARAAQRRLRRTEGRRGRLSRAEPGVHDRHLDAADGRIGRRGFPGAGQLPLRAGGSSARNAALPSAPKPSGCATTSPPASTATIFRKAGRFRSRSSAPKARSKMSAQAGIGAAVELFRAALRAGAACRWRNWCGRRRIRDAPRRRGRLARHALLLVGDRRRGHHRADVRARCHGKSA